MTAGPVMAAVIAFVVTLVAIAALARSAAAASLVDHPNERSLHARPTPRIGGLGILIGLLASAALLGVSAGLWLFLMALVLGVVSAFDDAQSLPVATRLGAHLVAAGLAVVVAGPAPAAATGLGLAWTIVAALAITWMTNLYNFMDGADGLAGGMAVIGFGALAWAAYAAGAGDLAAACSAVAATCVAFLVFNFPPARVFMGDAGSVPLGFLAGALGWLGLVRGVWPWWFPLVVFSPFIVDATVTLLRRIAASERVWKAHRSHYYQRLVLAGWSHRRLAAAEWALMLVAALSALLALGETAAMRNAILCVLALAYGFLAFAIDKKNPRIRLR